MQTAMQRAGNGNAGRSGSAGEDGKRKSRWRRLLEGERDEGLEVLAFSLRETDMARVEIERKRLVLDRDRMEREVADRAAERELRVGVPIVDRDRMSSAVAAFQRLLRTRAFLQVWSLSRPKPMLPKEVGAPTVCSYSWYFTVILIFIFA
ncbi:hypothetical protein BWQ96_04904 [Gracilariopsis chorda]|uniref:Uncharacterized protein n=1 Tax=Gracilariopsis chorda TaxID=448386 RepID=A0A2V3ITE9_9FLOR|nr:hypothetical protein BWQ96_04904 [Gracilariopsis chorda]|eukprot:PXF45384.1 hypothetical protein BWQ96_04904 [Gracilariopsis chorda]